VAHYNTLYAYTHITCNAQEIQYITMSNNKDQYCYPLNEGFNV